VTGNHAVNARIAWISGGLAVDELKVGCARRHMRCDLQVSIWRLLAMNRNHFFMIGIVILFVGIQFRVVDKFVLNEPVSEFVAKRIKKDDKPAFFTTSLFDSSTPREVIQPPRWLGWAMVSVGGVIVLYALAMPKPD